MDNERDAIERPVRLSEAVKQLGLQVNSLDKYSRINDDPNNFNPDKLNVSRIGAKGWRHVTQSEIDRYKKVRGKVI